MVANAGVKKRLRNRLSEEVSILRFLHTCTEILLRGTNHGEGAPNHLINEGLNQLTLIKDLREPKILIHCHLCWAHGPAWHTYKMVMIKQSLTARLIILIRLNGLILVVAFPVFALRLCKILPLSIIISFLLLCVCPKGILNLLIRVLVIIVWWNIMRV